MKRLLGYSVVLAMMAVTTIVVAQDPQTETSHLAWFDAENCDACKHMAADGEMMKQVKWETHLIDNGALSIAVIPEEFVSKMGAAKREMKQAISKVAAGDDIKCCGYCKSAGHLIAEGVKLREIASVGGDISIMTSDDPAIVAKIHDHAKRTISEHKKMVDALKQNTDVREEEAIPTTRDK